MAGKIKVIGNNIFNFLTHFHNIILKNDENLKGKHQFYFLYSKLICLIAFYLNNI